MIMSTIPIPPVGDRGNTGEKVLSEERREHIAAFINDVLRPAGKIIQEEADQIKAIQAFESRPYQVEAWDVLWAAREAGADRGLIHLATGLGKTSVAVFDYARFRKEQKAKGETARALFVVHQNAILEQADERFNEVLPHVLPGVGMSRFFNKSANLPEGEVVFATFQSLYGGAHKFPPDYFDYIVYDEAHHIEATTYKKVVDYFTPKFQLGLTATPERGDGKDITDHFGEALYTKTLPEGIAEGYLADVHYRLMLDEETKQLLQSGFRPKNMTELNKIFDFDPKPEDVAEAIRAAQQEIREKTGLENVKTIIFSSDIAAVDEMARLMGGDGYHSGIGSEKDKKAVLDAFRSGELETIVTRDMFNEGVDIPDARLIVFFRSTQSKTIFEQQLGRGLRKTADKDDVTVLDFVANAERIQLISELASEVKKTRCRNGTMETEEGGNRGGLSIVAGKSDFEFDEQIVDILALYGYFKEKNEDKIDWNGWSDEQIFELARQLSPDAALRVGDISNFSKEGAFPSVLYIYKRFSSITDFQRACGFDIPTARDWRGVTAEELIEIARVLKPGEPITAEDIDNYSRDVFPSSRVIRKVFGGIKKFQEALGYTLPNWDEYTLEELTQRALTLSPDKALSFSAIDKISRTSFPSSRYITRRFGGIGKFHAACGFPAYDNKSRWSDSTKEDIVGAIRDLFPDKAPTASDIRNASEQNLLPSYGILRRLFADGKNLSTEDLLTQAGYEFVVKRDWLNATKEELVKIATSVSPGSPLTGSQARKLDKNIFPPEHVVLRLFGGSWVEFQRACGFEVNNWNEWSDEQIIHRILEISPDKPISSKELNTNSRSGRLPSMPYLVKRFGGKDGRLSDIHRATGFANNA